MHLFKCINIYSCQQVSVLPDDAASQPPQRTSPRIARFLVEDGEPFYYVFVEQKPLLQCHSLTKAFFTWFMCHYAFNLTYHKYYADMAHFIQEFIFKLPEDKGKRSANYLSVATAILKSIT